MTAPRTPAEALEAAARAVEAHAAPYSDELITPIMRRLAAAIRALPVAEVATGIDLAAIEADRGAVVRICAPSAPAAQRLATVHVPALLAAVREAVRERDAALQAPRIASEDANEAQAREARLREQMAEWRTEVYRLRALAHSLCCCGPIADALDGCRVHPHGAEDPAALSREAPASPERYYDVRGPSGDERDDEPESPEPTPGLLFCGSCMRDLDEAPAANCGRPKRHAERARQGAP